MECSFSAGSMPLSFDQPAQHETAVCPAQVLRSTCFWICRRACSQGTTLRSGIGCSDPVAFPSLLPLILPLDALTLLPLEKVGTNPQPREIGGMKQSIWQKRDGVLLRDDRGLNELPTGGVVIP